MSNTAIIAAHLALALKDYEKSSPPVIVSDAHNIFALARSHQRHWAKHMNGKADGTDTVSKTDAVIAAIREVAKSYNIMVRDQSDPRYPTIILATYREGHDHIITLLP